MYYVDQPSLHKHSLSWSERLKNNLKNDNNFAVKIDTLLQF